MKFFKFAEQQILKAQREGKLDNLKGAGKPLNVKTTSDPVTSFGYDVMHQAGVVPAEIDLKKSIQKQAQKLQGITDPEEYKRELRILSDLQTRLGITADARRKFTE